MKHKHAEMIKAKVDDMKLVLLVKYKGEWKKSSYDIPTTEHSEYCLCHPKHVNETICWLNGGVVECHNDDFDDIFFTSSDIEPWKEHHWYMDENITSRIKPKKESRWIVVYGSHFGLCSKAFSSHYEAEGFNLFEPKGQIIEIEIEI